MSIQAVAWALDHSESRGLARLVLISLANHANEAAECWPAHRTIAREAGISVGAVSDQIRNLIELGEIKVLEAGGPRRSARYQLPKIQRSGDEHKSENERSGDERSAHPRGGRSVHSRSGQNRHLTVIEEEATPTPPVRAREWAVKWAEVRGVTPTRSVLRSWVPKVQEFLNAGGVPSDELLDAAHRAGIESPGGWGFVAGKVRESGDLQRVNDWMNS